MTSTVRVNQQREVCDTLLLTPMENSQSHSEMASNEDLWSRGPEGCCQRERRLPSKFTLSPDLFATLHKPKTRWFAWSLLLGLSKKVCRRSPVCCYITDSRASRSKAVALPNRKSCLSWNQLRKGFACSPRWFYCAASTCTVVRSFWWGLRDVS